MWPLTILGFSMIGAIGLSSTTRRPQVSGKASVGVAGDGSPSPAAGNCENDQVRGEGGGEKKGEEKTEEN